MYPAQRQLSEVDSRQLHGWDFMGNPLTHYAPSPLSWQVIFLKNLAFMHTVFLHTHLPRVAQSSLQQHSSLSLSLSPPLLISPSLCHHLVRHRADGTVDLQCRRKWGCATRTLTCSALCMTSLDLFQALRPRNTHTIYFTITITERR